MKVNNKSGFTLLEVIIVIIIVGVLASLALPRFFSTVEFSKGTEALASMAALRQSMERCYLSNSQTFLGCTIDVLDVANPTNTVGSHFSYNVLNLAATTYDIQAKRNSTDGGDATSLITLQQLTTSVKRSGTTVYSGIK